MAMLAPRLTAQVQTYTIAIDPGNPSKIYAGTDKGVLISTDGGSNWAAANTGLPLARVTSLAIDPSNHLVVYAGSITVFKTTDGGAHWAPTGRGAPPVALGVAALAIDPSNPALVYAGLFANTGPGVMISRDGGSTWVPSSSDVLPFTTFDGLAIDPRNTSTVFAASMNGGIFKTADSGLHWADASKGLPAVADTTGGLPAIHVHALAMDPNNSSILYARLRGGGVYKTTDGGRNWAPANNGLAGSKDLASFPSALAIDPTNSQIVYTGSVSGGVFKTTDGGANWTAMNAGLPDNSGAALAIDPTNPSVIYAGTNDGRIFKSTDGAATFATGSAAPPPNLSAIGSLSQIASAGTWKMSLNFLNQGASASQIRAKFYNNSGAPMILPLAFPQVPGSGSLPTSSLDRTLPPGAQLVIESSGLDSAPALIGWAQLFSDSSVDGFGLFSNAALGWNAVVPLETRNANSYILAFDNTGALATGVAVANIAAAAAIPVIIRDDTGVQIGTNTVNLPGQGHDSFTLKEKFPETINRRGTIQFLTPNFGSQTPGQISVLGLRANGPALTTLPVMANVGSTGGSIAHATYNGGFTSIFYVVNTGTLSASFTLSFFDESGNPLTVPLSLPQSGTTTTSTALTRTLPAGAMLVAETQAQDALPSVLGSAQLTTTGNISAFEVFRWTTFGQEASVPLETRAPKSFVLAFDDTGGLTTGVALANQTTAAANVTANIFDDAGTLLQTTTISLAARGHTSFLLPSNFGVTVNKRGIVEFVVPTGGQIGVIGLRAKADGTLTTIPVLAK